LGSDRVLFGGGRRFHHQSHRFVQFGGVLVSLPVSLGQLGAKKLDFLLLLLELLSEIRKLRQGRCSRPQCCVCRLQCLSKLVTLSTQSGNALLEIAILVLKLSNLVRRGQDLGSQAGDSRISSNLQTPKDGKSTQRMGDPVSQMVLP
jgi:hypothetical protein